MNDVKEVKSSFENIGQIYDLLVQSQEVIQNHLNYIEEPDSRACLTVLYDDICALIEESEELIFSEPNFRSIVSLKNRADTILGEVKHALRAGVASESIFYQTMRYRSPISYNSRGSYYSRLS